MIRNLHNDAEMFRKMSAWAGSRPESEWHAIDRDPAHPHAVISPDLPPYGKGVFVRYPRSVGIGTRCKDAAGSTWLGLGVDGGIPRRVVTHTGLALYCLHALLG